MIPLDKLVHFLVGFAAAAILGMAGHPVLGLCAAVVAGIGKEVWDYFNPPHAADALDALATIMGGLLAFLVQWWFQ